MNTPRILFPLIATAALNCEAANCALRNHARTHSTLMPEYTSYVTVNGIIDQQTKQSVERRLGRELSFSELGRTTMCILYRGQAPIGFVHARSELGQRGTVELVWAVDLEMKIRGFTVQRSRERQTGAIRQPGFAAALKGRDWSGMADLLRNPDQLNVDAAGREIARLAIDCGEKTLLFIEAGFADAVLNARMIGFTHRFFPGVNRITGVPAPTLATAINQLESSLGRPPRHVTASNTLVLRARDEADAVIGSVVRIGADSGSPESIFKVSPDGKITDSVRRGITDEEAGDRRAEAIALLQLLP